MRCFGGRCLPLSAFAGLLCTAQAQVIYWSEAPIFTEARISRANVDGTDQERLVSGLNFGPRAVALDQAHRKIFWVKSTYDGKQHYATIQRASLDGANVIDLVTKIVGAPRGLALDVVGGRMYWTNISAVYSSSIDGGEVRSFAFALSPWAVAVDSTSRTLYWTDIEGIWRIKLDGTQLRQLTANDSFTYPTGLALDLSGGKMYWTVANLRKVKRANLDGTQVQELASVTGSYPEGIALDLNAGKLYWAEGRHIRRANLDGSNVEDIGIGSGFAQAFAIDPTDRMMYWSDFSAQAIWRANLDGSGREAVVRSDLALPGHLNLDLIAGHMYWIDSGSGFIRRADLDGAQLVDVYSDTSYHYGLALDIAQRKMYWAQSPDNKIRRANLDGSNVEDLVAIGTTQSTYIPDVALDLPAGKMYWGDYSGKKLQRSNLDGSDIEDVITDQRPVQIAIDTMHGKIYWNNNGREIHRANTDGSAEEVLLSGSIFGLLSLDLVNGKMYRTERDDFDSAPKLRRANLDGTEVEDVPLVGLEALSSIALDLRAPGDFTDDGRIDLRDFAYFASCFTGADAAMDGPQCPFFDVVSDDDHIALEDFADLLQHFTSP